MRKTGHCVCGQSLGRLGNMRISLGKGSAVVSVAFTALFAAANALGLSRWVWGSLGVVAIVALLVAIVSLPRLTTHVPLLGKLPLYAEWDERKRIVERLTRERYDGDRLSRREIVHPDGKEETEIFLTAAIEAALTAHATATVEPPTA